MRRTFTGSTWFRLLVVTIFAVAMAYMESAVVVYLGVIFPRSVDLATLAAKRYDVWFSVPFFTLLKPGALASVLPQSKLASVEVAREAATIVMLVCAGWLAGHDFKTRAAFFIYAFGVWDIGYYVFLYAVLGWPTSFGSLDVLFLIPGPWVAPVFVPVAISTAMIIGAVFSLRQDAASSRQG